MKKSSDVIMESIVSGTGLRRNVEMMAMWGGIPATLPSTL